MSRRQLARRPENRAERNLTLVPPPKPRRRPKSRFKVGRALFKAKWPPERLAYEEDIVYGVVVAMGGKVTVREMLDRYPGRFDDQHLYWTLCRLVGSGRLSSGRGINRRSGLGIFDGSPSWRKAKAWFERHKVAYYRGFWTPESKHGR